MSSNVVRWRSAAISTLILTGLAGCASPSDGPRALVPGGDGGGIARAQPAEEHFDAAALDQAAKDPAASALQALVVLRHGHLIYERFGHGVDAQSVLDLGDFAQALTGLVTGIAVHEDVLPLPMRSAFEPARLRDAIEQVTHRSYADYLSAHLWRQLNAAPAWIALNAPAAAAPADCCFHARVLDWMRVAALLVQDGRFEGKQVVPPGWVARMRQPVSLDGERGFGIELPVAAHGAEAIAADDAFFVRGPGHWRLWLIPSLQLAVLFGSQAQQSATGSNDWDETRVPNLVLRALSDPAKPLDVASKLQQLVPGH
jgi:CubicO group peptidase (beta-lactamase class C family)